MLLTVDVLNKGTDSNDTQFWNIRLMFVREAVLNKGTDFNDEQPLNIPCILVT
jgi:hypothetical protein